MAIGTAAALAIGATAVGGVASSVVGARAAGNAADAQAAAANTAAGVERQNFLDGLEVIQPAIDAGNRARSALEYEIGLGPRPVFGGDADLSSVPEILFGPGEPYVRPGPIIPGTEGERGPPVSGRGPDLYYFNGTRYLSEAAANNALSQYIQDNSTELSGPAFAYQGFEATPGYEFRVSEGEKAIERAMAARGLSNSGALLRDTERFRQGIAASEYGDHLNRLASMSGQGQVATQQAFAGYQNQGNALAGIELQRGNAQASSYIGQANAINQGIGSFTNALGFYAGFN